jgi:N-acetylglucosaminyldiphosphoundecaprenol N-acetyl-beta-D-mannosaminyltransferase
VESVESKRIKVLDMPVDAVDAEGAFTAVERMLQDGAHGQVVLLSVRDLLRARHDPELARCLRDAALILPVNRGLLRGALFLGAGNLTLFNPFDFLIRVLSLVEKKKGSVYLLGARKDVLETAEKNLRGSFHALRIVGRFCGFFPREAEGDIVTAIKKAAPTVVLAGTGIPGREKWIFRHKKDYNPGVSLWIGNGFEIFSGAEKQPSRRLHAMGLEAVNGLRKKPWKVFAAFPYLYYLALLAAYRIFKL